jgi:hypothetical protein
MKMVIALLMVAAMTAGAAAWLVHEVRMVTEADSVAVPMESTAPKIEEIRLMSKLVLAELKISFTHTQKLESGTLIGAKVGSVTALFAVRGDVEVATDMGAATYAHVDHQKQVAVLRLPEPAAGRPRVDHERTQVLRFERGGVWTILPGHAPEQKVTSDGFREIQRELERHAIAERATYIGDAKKHAQEELSHFYEALGWKLEVVWGDETFIPPVDADPEPGKTLPPDGDS